MFSVVMTNVWKEEMNRKKSQRKIEKSNVVIDLYVGGEARSLLLFLLWHARARGNDKQMNSSLAHVVYKGAIEKYVNLQEINFSSYSKYLALLFLLKAIIILLLKTRNFFFLLTLGQIANQ